ncbi:MULTISPECIES: DNA mismatch repair endonuclease MutL [Mammaliicoccus]|uniref:DNA mismatch repair endonuclease MutL n=1 Tax=Mammaliicoccus TaxID=2803850 RepID=UPI000472F22E|nr:MULTISPECIES: DNA mismatch repair endonuclease MutL [Mammaliicoccus]MCD8798233.1 DNA mismatch repair endonuclease MutL [Mammaliicoccus sciuri]MCE5058688.1 DNA mismatch repair endonuclease MutL [Mammaliicoccus sciuri]MDT0696370.1 DNA mismatch repair endonuclease MutL [Mammaliicoccus sciuri]MEB6215488.1 DNA mismatch repair endonuclease MutL [Mammaliicoccus sciuri]MEB6330612.1 DNA mismatch repair endonuclease MutL [Mammaliicoccus sciuri]
MGKIKELELSLANKIAAGEVVERPASVVKELLENAIDAQATQIDITIKESGIQSIRVVDNGTGIEEDDIAKAFGRHATSKINNDYDLFHIRTLGFRGEALASISSVSRVTMKTCTDGMLGHEVRVENGEITKKQPAKAKKGTDILVEDLFYNTPARLKYVKSLYTELGKITDIVNRMAMSHPNIAFNLVSDDKTVISTNGSGRTNEVMAEIYGMKIAKDLVPINGETDDYVVNGFICKPEHTRSNRHYISIFINGRYIKNFVLNKAIIEGYHTLLPIGRYPIVYLNIEMDPILVDVNVHPTKLEVRLSKEQLLYDLINQKIKEAFRGMSLIPDTSLEKQKPKKSQKEIFEQQKIDFEAKRNQNITQQQQVSHKSESVEEIEKTNDATSREPSPSWQFKDKTEHHSVIQEDTIKQEDNRDIDVQHDEPEHIENNEETYEVQDTVEYVDTPYQAPIEEEQVSEAPRVPYMEVVGQVHGTYIVAQNDTGMFMIDQHAAQERIKYEFFKEKIGEVTNETQSLLLPLTFNFSKDEHMIIEKYLQSLAEAGVFLEPIGHHDYMVSEYPVWLPNVDAEEIIKDMIDYVLNHEKVDIKKLREDAAIMMSCKKSIKANHYLRNHEMSHLIDELRETTDPFTCPHGRPIIIELTTYELEKLFKRVM